MPGASPEMIDKTQAWEALAKKHSVPLASVAIAFGLWPTAVTHVVIGWGSPLEVEQSIGWAETMVPVELWIQAGALGLLPPAVVAAMQPGKRKRGL